MWLEYEEIQNLIIDRINKFDEQLATKIKNSIDDKKPQFVINNFDRMMIDFYEQGRRCSIVLDDTLILDLTKHADGGVEYLELDIHYSEVE